MNKKLWLTLLFFSSAASSQVVSPFAGSELLGQYETDFARLHYMLRDGEAIGHANAEGRLLSRIYRQPADKSNLEVLRSFQDALTSEGFELLGVIEEKPQVEIQARIANGPNGNALGERPYASGGRTLGVGDKAQIATQVQEYLSARRVVGATELLVVISTNRSGSYLIEELESAAMEQGTVVLTLDALRDEIDVEGRIALYGIRFATGSATIQPESTDTLDTIVSYLTENSERYFYVVGHTDDVGSLSSNMALSEARAQAVVDALVAVLPGARDKLIARGVGPLSPVATNGADDGRALNRRVELVSTHP